MTLTTGCVPTHAAHLRVPVAFVAPPTGGDLTVTAKYQAIRRHMPDFDPDTAAFYARGRIALPFRTEDTDGDGIADAVTVTFASLPNLEAWLLIVCPGVRATGRAIDPTGSRRVRLDFTRARR